MLKGSVIMRESLLVKIDKVGRIVIPRKIRQQFNIRGNEYLSVVLQENSFLLYKNNYEEEYLKFINKLKKIELEYELDIIVSNKEKIVYTSNRYNLIENKNISEDLKTMFDYKNFDTFRIRLTKDYILGSSYCYCVSSLEFYTKFLVIIPYKNKDEKKLAELVLKLLS